MKKASPAIYWYMEEEYVLLQELAELKEVHSETMWQRYLDALGLPDVNELKWVDNNDELHFVRPPLQEICRLLASMNFEQPVYIPASLAYWILEVRDNLWRAAAIRMKSS